MLPELHLAKDAFALHLLLQRPQRLIDVVVPNHYLHVRHHLSVFWVFQELGYIHRAEGAVQPQAATGGPEMTETPQSEHEHIEAVRDTIVEAALPHVPFDGWTQVTLDMAVRETGTDPALAHLAFPRGGIDLALAFHRLADRRLEEEMASVDLSAMRIRDRVTHCVRRRIELVAEHREAVRRGATLFALPVHALDASRAVWETADLIWRLCGDTATDYNWYTKRMILGSVYSSTMLYWLGDQDPRAQPTWEFLDRRIEDVMRFEKVKASLGKNPVARLAFWGPSQVLKLVRAPGARMSARDRTPDHDYGADQPGPDEV